MNSLDIRTVLPPQAWGVRVNDDAVLLLAGRWREGSFPLPAWDYPGLPRQRTPSEWFDFCGLAVSVLACLWPPEGEEMWAAEHGGVWLEDAPGMFACMDRGLPRTAEGLDARLFLDWTDRDAREFFAGRGTLQLIPERRQTLQEVAGVLVDRWDGHFSNLVEAAGFSAPKVVELLVDSFPSYRDEWESDRGVLPFNKLAHLAAAMMAAGGSVAFSGLETFPVYPDYMLPMVLRHAGVLVYDEKLADTVDRRLLVPAGSKWELAIRWATVHTGDRLTKALNELGNRVTSPALDYFLWHQAVLGPKAGTMGEHHRTVTMAY